MKVSMRNVSTFVAVIAIILLVSLIMAYPLMLLWNACLVPAVTVLNPVSWLQMWGIEIIVTAMFKSNVKTTT